MIMDNKVNLKELWNKQNTQIPDTKELIEKMNAFRKNSLRRIIITNILLILTSAFISFIWYYFRPEMISTKIGILLCIAAMIMFIFVSNQSAPLLSKVDFDLSVRDYLNQLRKFKEKQNFLQTVILNIYFILLSAGICLYMFEYTSKMTFNWAVFSYFMALFWIAFNWFYLRPKQIRKQRAKTDELIGKLKLMDSQLSDDQNISVNKI